MQRELLQEKSLNRSQDNAEKSLNVDLSAKSRLIPYSTTAGMLGLNDLYIEERDACETYRMIFTVNPVCTNALYNAVTEPVYKEGSISAFCLVESSVTRDNSDIFPEGVLNQSADTNDEICVVDQISAVRDTEFSHTRIGDFIYHCGYDIFNNHLLRTDDFVHVQMDETEAETNKTVFNTIFDFAVDYSGKTITRILGDSTGPYGGGWRATSKNETSSLDTGGFTGEVGQEPDDENDSEAPDETTTGIGGTPSWAPNKGNTGKTNVRMYQLDTIKSMNTAFYDGLRLVDGWYGFYNSGYIEIPNGKLGKENEEKEDIFINHIINNKPSCGFIDLYPDRSLYSFIPKPNRFRKRLERNWDCTIVYPFENDYDTFNMLNDNKVNAVKIINAKVIYNNVGDQLIQFHSLLRHTLIAGSEVRLFYRGDEEDADMQISLVPITVINVGNTEGDEENRYFTIKYSDVATFCIIDEETNDILLRNGRGTGGTPIHFFYKKVEGGYENRYYFRKFKELKNYQYIQSPEKPEDAVVVTKEPTFINENSPSVILFKGNYFKKVGVPLNYSQNKIAFASNIYGDRVAQVIFNDDICVSGLKDNIGRNLSKIYFMAEKTNRGHKEWYEEGNVSAETVEFSHCFGEVTSGLDLPADNESTEYNVRKLYNVFRDECDGAYSGGLETILEEAPKGEYSGTPTPLESAITLNINDENYRDVFFGDIIEFSKVNFMETEIEKVYHRFNTAQRECLTNTKYFDIHYDELVGDLFDVSAVTEGQTTGYSIGEFTVSSYTLNNIDGVMFPGNITPEGYFYSPFYEVALKELDDEPQNVNVKRINFSPASASVTTGETTFYDPVLGFNEKKTLYYIKLKSPIPYDLILFQPFCIYDVMTDMTYRGYLDKIEGLELTIATESEIEDSGINGSQDLEKHRSRYIISYLEDNAPTYAEFIPSTQKLIWRETKKMSDLLNESPLYNMPFTNGRLYIHQNVNVFVRRQDSNNDFKLFRPSLQNPLRRFQIEGSRKIDFDQIKYIIDSMVDSC